MILIAEDESNARQLFARILSRTGHQVLQGKDGEEALRLFDNYPVDLLITDLAMPKITGLGLIRHIRAKSTSLPIIIVSAYLSPDDAKNIADENVDFIPKPVDRDCLLATVNRLLPRYS